jgi:hypothetical protein
MKRIFYASNDSDMAHGGLVGFEGYLERTLNFCTLLRRKLCKKQKYCDRGGKLACCKQVIVTR